MEPVQKPSQDLKQVRTDGKPSHLATLVAIHTVRILLERHREKNLTVHTSFLDLEKAFDLVPHDLIRQALRSHGLPETYIRWVKMLYDNTTSVVRTPAGTSPPFPIRVGVH